MGDPGKCARARARVAWSLNVSQEVSCGNDPRERTEGATEREEAVIQGSLGDPR